ncbi:glycosyltransferase, exosortase A system-associated [Nitrogeniibacter mangrovi]|uniref:Glycosyltransferase, exosortase A system-associated n=1 Tax=Nitrogeniibacter mangrovi TaxID=2016596 RepID=A0A6C1B4C6_9RHOO|nr:TIGR04063 family PEP-CTERM/XrtA system glycosyltransferase [Nitrogeniibacter mangrovi]QID18542.1 glycosyltransferase, exosortase A system-associated [Nitrogeniibacter mangrovi]
MRVVHVLDHSIPLHSGYTFRTANLLKGQRALGWETFHLTSPKQGMTDALVEEVDGLTFHRTPVPGVSLPVLGELAMMRAIESRLDALVAQLRPDVIHAHSPVLNALPALKVGRRAGIPVVYEVRAFWEDAAVDHGTTRENSLRYRLTRALETRALKRADHVFTICEGLRNDMLGRGIPGAKVTVIPNAVNVDSFQMGGVADEALKSSLGLAGCEVIGFIGSFYAYEGLDLLLEAFSRLSARRPSARMLLVGGGPQEDKLKQQANALGIADRVVFTGRVPHAEVQRYYDLVDVLAYPRHSMRLTELVTPLKPLEAMAQGRIFIASDVGGHKELIRDGETGVLFPAGNAEALAGSIDELFARRSAWDDMRQAGRRFVEDVRNWTNSVAQYVPVYQALTGRSG